jgi:arylsulfatase A-like enzyme
MIARLPGKVKAGAVDATPGYFPDWFPTLCAAAGIQPPEGLDGTNLWPGFTRQTPAVPRKSPMVWAYQEYGGQVAVIFENDVKVIRKGLLNPKPQSWEVYDLAADPAESNNLAAIRPDAIAETIKILKREVAPNRLFPLTIPGVNP